MADLPAVARPTLWGRLVRALSVLLRPTEHVAGADYVEAASASPGYSAEQAMSAYAAFAWAKACADAVSEDLSGLPIRVRRGRGALAVRVESHPVLDLLAQPTRRQADGRLFRQQIIVDWLLTGNAIIGLYGGAATPDGRVTRPPGAMYRWHPARTTIRPSKSGEAEAYEHNGAGSVERLPWSLVLHWRGPSWEDGVESLWGSGAIRALHNDLTAELASTTRLTEASRQGRPQAVATPKGDDILTDTTVQEFAASLRRAFAKADGGVAVLGAGLDLQVLGWSPREMEFGAQRTWTRETVLAAFGVPPTRVGLPMANYATANQQERGYWQSLQQRVAGLDAQLTRLARMWPGSEDVEVYHDFAAVAALQEDRSVRLQRVIDMVTMLGSDPAEAAAYEGLPDLPVGDASLPAPEAPPAAPAPAPAAEPASPGDTPQQGQRAAPPTGERARAAAWQSWVATLQGRHERLIAAAMVRFLRGQRRRIADGLRAADDGRGLDGVVTREPLASLLDRLVGPAEAARLRAAIGGLLAGALRAAFGRAARDLPGSGIYDPVRMGEDGIITDLVSRVTQTTRDAIGRAIQTGLAEGQTTLEIATEIERLPEMGPRRAITVARTESSRATNAGAWQAASEANAVLGGGVELEWLSARDEVVRDEHRQLDGQRVPVGGRFTVGGHTASHPGDFGVASLDINCRCTTVPVLPE